MEKPESFLEGNGDKVCLLNKAIYGLKQASSAWYKTLEAAMHNIGFQNSNIEPCVFYKQVSQEETIIVTSYVDDLLCFCTDPKDFQDVKEQLSKEFDIKDLGEVSSYLSIGICRGQDGAVFLNQRGYVDSILRLFKMEGCNPVQTPVCTSQQLTRETASTNDYPYQQLIGRLMYLAIWTRPDIMYAVSMLSQFNTCHGEPHWNAAKRVLRYLKGTRNHGIMYTKTNANINVFSDADWGSSSDRKSYSGTVAVMSGGAVLWSSRKQRCTSLSSTESELIALSESCKDAMYIKGFMQELNLEFTTPVSIACDNTGTVAIAQQDGHHPKRLRHVEIRHFYVRDCVASGDVVVHHIRTGDMTADVLTKGLPHLQHEKCSSEMGVKALMLLPA